MITELIQKLPEKEQEKWLEALKEERRSWEDGLKCTADDLGILTPPMGEDGEFLSTFETPDGRRWRILEPGTAIGIERFTSFQKLSIALGFGKTFKQLVETFYELQKKAVAEEDYSSLRINLVLHIQAIIDGIQNVSKERFDLSFYMATLFIVEEGKEKEPWTEQMALEMIKAWRDNNLSEVFFLKISSLRVNGFAKIWNDLRAANKKRESRGILEGGDGTPRATQETPSQK